MRLVDVLVGSVLIGAALGLVLPAQPSAATMPGASVASTCSSLLCQRITWLRAPLLRTARSQ
jgi:hypothetical protein